MVIVDSSAWIEALRRQGSLEVKVAVEALLEIYEAQLCAPVRLEVLGGAREEDRRRLSACFSVIPYRNCRRADWEAAIALAWRLRSRGISVPWMDVLVAAIAIADGTRVYAVDRHFRQITAHSGLRLYAPGYGGGFTPDADASKGS